MISSCTSDCSVVGFRGDKAYGPADQCGAAKHRTPITNFANHASTSTALQLQPAVYDLSLATVANKKSSLPECDASIRPALAGDFVCSYRHGAIVHTGDMIEDVVAVAIPAVDSIGEMRLCRLDVKLPILEQGEFQLPTQVERVGLSEQQSAGALPMLAHFALFRQCGNIRPRIANGTKQVAARETQRSSQFLRKIRDR